LKKNKENTKHHEEQMKKLNNEDSKVKQVFALKEIQRNGEE